MEGVRGEDERHTGRGPGEVGGWKIRRGGQVQFLGTILDLGASERGGPRVSCSGSWAEVGARPRGCVQEQGKERSLRGAVRAPEAAVQLPGAQVKRSITVA